MPSPFPGMNPYLEQPALWPEFHNRLLVAISDALTPDLQPKYYVAVETRTYLDNEVEDLLVGIPDAAVVKAPMPSPPADAAAGIAIKAKPQQVRLPMPVEVKERYLEVRAVGCNQVITVMEVLSPTNKRKGKGRDIYEHKRQRVLGSATHLVEIDLLRMYAPMAMAGVEDRQDYRIVVSRYAQRPYADLYGFGLRDPIPSFLLPLASEDAERVVDLQSVLLDVYTRGSYEFRIDYSHPVPLPGLSEEDQRWVDEKLASWRAG